MGNRRELGKSCRSNYLRQNYCFKINQLLFVTNTPNSQMSHSAAPCWPGSRSSWTTTQNGSAGVCWDKRDKENCQQGQQGRAVINTRKVDIGAEVEAVFKEQIAQTNWSQVVASLGKSF